MDFIFSKNSDLSLKKALSLEWLETNGLGGYASSTILNCHTRKYHGLLVSKLENFPNKYVLLSKLEDVLVKDSQEYHLSAHSYPNCFVDGSFANIQEAKVTSHPSINFDFAGMALTKEILMPFEEDTVLFKYRVASSSNANKITIRPLIAARDFHKLSGENTFINGVATDCRNGKKVATYEGMPALFFQTNVTFEYLSQPLWYRNFIYEEEQARGYDFQEDLFSPGIFTLHFNSHHEIVFSASTVEQSIDLAKKWQQEVIRRAKVFQEIKGSEFQRQLQKAGRSFLIKNHQHSSPNVVAGYHWFLEWGRDALISLPGLTLYSGQEETCLEILKTYAEQQSQGLIPNFLGITKEQNAYNSVDASLWFAWAVQQYYIRTKDLTSVGKYLLPTLKAIFNAYKSGTIHNIKMHENGLLYAGSPEENLTWMDAMVGGKPVTPRYGFAVEINALWYNFLEFLAELTGLRLESIKYELKTISRRVQKSFVETFWNSNAGFLFDCVNSEQKKLALRPNQIFAVSLPYSPLVPKMAASIVKVVQQKLLTPYGLRTLAEGENGYCDSYFGGQVERDNAYHNGTVWPWLLGHFTDAVLKVVDDCKKAQEILRPTLEALEAHLAEYGIGYIAEIFSGGKPHCPNGCIAQAWSVAEILRTTYLLGA